MLSETETKHESHIQKAADVGPPRVDMACSIQMQISRHDSINFDAICQ